MYIHSNIVGVFVLNQNFQIREKIFFSKNELAGVAELFEKGEFPDKDLSKKFKNIDQIEDAEALHAFYDKFHENNLYLTKLQLRESVQQDQLIIQASEAIADLNRSINILAKRLREWYIYSLPELEHRIADHKKFAELVLNSRSDLIKKFDISESMGVKLSKKDEDQIQGLAKDIILLFKEKETKEKYLERLMKECCPNMTTVAGYLIGAQLMAHAGSLKKLMLMPSSTVQLLGAERALFRHLVNKKARPPKHGLILQHELLQKAKKSDRGKAARALADKISIAVKVDYFKGEFIGDKLRKELEEKLS